MEALQLMNHPRVDAVLAEHIAGDPFIDARMAALRATHLRQPSPAVEQAAIKAAQTDKAPGVRLEAVRVLQGWLRTRPSLRPILQSIADNETHEGVRAQARSAVLTPTGRRRVDPSALRTSAGERRILRLDCEGVGAARFELTTPGSGGRCSIQMSYAPD